jgi:hypothetical protein
LAKKTTKISKEEYEDVCKDIDCFLVSEVPEEPSEFMEKIYSKDEEKETESIIN